MAPVPQGKVICCQDFEASNLYMDNFKISTFHPNYFLEIQKHLCNCGRLQNMAMASYGPVCKDPLQGVLVDPPFINFQIPQTWTGLVNCLLKRLELK